MRVKEIMTQDVKTCGAEDRLSTAARIMWDNDCGIVPIVADDGRLLGVVTDRDVCIACWSRDARPSEIPAAQAMSTALKTCSADDTVETAGQIMETSQVRRLPVTDTDGWLVGLISVSDLARAAARAQTVKQKGIPSTRFLGTIAAICRPRPATRHAPALVAS